MSTKKVIKSILRFFTIDKIFAGIRDVKANGGVSASMKKAYRMETFRSGRLVGEDKYGNKYFEDPSYFIPRNRWVEYPKYKNLEYDASHVSPEWFGWLHHITDYPPYQDVVKMRTQFKWMLEHSENLTGTKDAYMPYSTTRPKIEAWDPKNPEGDKIVDEKEKKL